MISESQLDHLDGHTADWEKTGTRSRWSDFIVRELVTEVRRLQSELAAERETRVACSARLAELETQLQEYVERERLAAETIGDVYDACKRAEFVVDKLITASTGSVRRATNTASRTTRHTARR